MSQIKYFSLNGQYYYTNQNLTLVDIILYFNFSNSLFVLELNKVIYDQNKWQRTFITNHDKLEIISIVGGG